ncbi:RAB11-binding protein RELCH homolog [Chelonus insularis]|uniref:RAB11-binding protein RELCH homolog n=1 Tax=Chelonus insularis TaxID=460826 RepID=UPI00158A9DB4|nr:RAB11-binding protein RELCH homolog [Chelonus insularis]
MEQVSENWINRSSLNDSDNTQGEIMVGLESYNQIATKLLSEKLLLTALELHAELCEAGKELPILRDFFFNTNNFENCSYRPDSYMSIGKSSSQATLDSLDMTRYSEVDGEMNERVAILEFELRKAKANILALRTNLTVVTKSASTSPHKKLEEDSFKKQPIKPHEERALNYLVYEYLLMQSYKLTSITFSDENENQDFEDWEDVGLNIPKPPNLLHIYREFINKNENEKLIFSDASTQVNFNFQCHDNINIIENDNSDIAEEITYFERNFDQKSEKNQNLNKCVNEVDKKDISEYIFSENISHSFINSTSDPANELESFDKETGTYQESNASDCISTIISFEDINDNNKTTTQSSEAIPDLFTSLNLPSRYLPEYFRKQILGFVSNNLCDVGIPVIDNLADIYLTQDIINILIESLLVITPNIASNKKFEIIPLILATIKYYSTSVNCDKLVHLLFNLKKKPRQAERRVLIKALIFSIQLDNKRMLLEKIITLCWEQSQHQYPERRLLAVECCSALAPYASNEIRNSLITSMLQQILLEDKESAVRAKVVHSLSLLIMLTDDTDKYFQFEELTFTALEDESPKVFQIGLSILLPTLAQWALYLKRFLSHLMIRLLSRLKDQLIKMDKFDIKYSPNKDIRSIENIIKLIDALNILIPYTIVCVVDNPTIKNALQSETSSELPNKILSLCKLTITNPLIFSEYPEDTGKLINTFLINSWDEKIWPELEWFMKKFIPEILEMIKLIDVSQEKILTNFLIYFELVCKGFSSITVQSYLKNIFHEELLILERKITSNRESSSKMSLIPAHILVLSTSNTNELLQLLKHLNNMLANNSVDITGLLIGIKILCKQSELMEKIINVFFDDLLEQPSVVKSKTLKIFSRIIFGINENLVVTKIIPIIMKLINDPDVQVQVMVIEILGKIITGFKIEEMKNKSQIALENILKNYNDIPQELTIPIITILANIAPYCPQDYVENVILINLKKITILTLQHHVKIDIIIALINAFSNLIYCSLSEECIIGNLLFSLKQLDVIVSQQFLQQKDNVKLLIQQIEMRNNSVELKQRSLPTSSSSSPLTLIGTGQGVEDMKNKMSKLFASKPNSPIISHIFRKK